MSLTEFGVVARYFASLTPAAAQTVKGVGDDAALMQPSPGCQLVWSIDSLVEGVHFSAGADPASLGHKALAVNLSDLAAMGATPFGVLLALTLPTVDDAWCAAFAEGFGALAIQAGIPLVGGDMTRGPLTISVSVLGEVPVGRALRRDGAQLGDMVAVTGPLGDAALALHLGDEAPSALQSALHRPDPHLAAGLVMRDYAHAAIDVSDGLMADLQHICEASGVGAAIRVDCLPQSAAFANYRPANAADLQAAGGDDYVLCVTLAPDQIDDAQAALKRVGAGLTVIGRITEGTTASLLTADGAPVALSSRGFQHF